MSNSTDRPGTPLEWQKVQLDRVHRLLSQSVENAQTAMKILSGLQQAAAKEEGRLSNQELAAGTCSRNLQQPVRRCD